MFSIRTPQITPVINDAFEQMRASAIKFSEVVPAARWALGRQIE